MYNFVIIDSLSVDYASNVSGIYSDMIDKLQSQFNIILVVIGLIFATVIGATWWWNYKGSKAQITEEIQEGLKKYQRLLNIHRSSIDGLINQKVKDKIDELSKSLVSSLDDYKKDVSIDNKKLNADLSRVFALHCSSGKSYYNSATWWLHAFSLYVELEEGEFEQISIDAFISALEDCVKDEKLTDDQEERLADLEMKITKIPDVYKDHRKKAKTLLKKIADKAKKAPEGK